MLSVTQLYLALNNDFCMFPYTMAFPLRGPDFRVIRILHQSPEDRGTTVFSINLPAATEETH